MYCFIYFPHFGDRLCELDTYLCHQGRYIDYLALIGIQSLLLVA